MLPSHKKTVCTDLLFLGHLDTVYCSVPRLASRQVSKLAMAKMSLSGGENSAKIELLMKSKANQNVLQCAREIV